MKKRAWESDKQWADQFMPEVKRILGEALMCEAPMSLDTTENTDLIVVHMEPFRVGVRVRNYNKYIDRVEEWGDQITIRSKRRNAETEFQKIMRGFGEYFFYGWGDDIQEILRLYALIALDPFRYWIFHETARQRQPWVEKKNGDGSSDFAVFNLSDLPDECIVRHQEYVPF
jgi:hypothetical protein